MQQQIISSGPTASSHLFGAFSIAALAAALAIFSANSASRMEDWLMVLMSGLLMEAVWARGGGCNDQMVLNSNVV